MAHGHGHSPQPLPEVVYSIVDHEALVPPAVNDKLAESFGFNKGVEWSGSGKTGAEAGDKDGRYLRWLRKPNSRASWCG